MVACGDREDLLQFLRLLPSLREGKRRRNCKRGSCRGKASARTRLLRSSAHMEGRDLKGITPHLGYKLKASLTRSATPPGVGMKGSLPCGLCREAQYAPVQLAIGAGTGGPAGVVRHRTCDEIGPAFAFRVEPQ